MANTSLVKSRIHQINASLIGKEDDSFRNSNQAWLFDEDLKAVKSFSKLVAELTRVDDMSNRLKKALNAR